MVTTCIMLPSGWTANPPPLHPSTFLQGPLPLTLHSLECVPLRGTTEAWGALQRPPITQLQGNKGLEEHSRVTAHTSTVPAVYRCCL